MKICGLQKLSMVDYPGKIAATVFTGGCNLRCPFCHNALLVTRLPESPELEESEVLRFLDSRKKLLDAVVISGGEPLLQPDIPDFLRKVRDIGLPVKLDTNGCYPGVLEKLLAEKLIGYVAMDIKNSPEKYAQTVGRSHFDMGPIEKSCQLLRESGIDYEFRTTALREFHTLEDIRRIGTWLRGAPRYYLQNFVDSDNLIGAGLHGFSPEEMKALADAARPCFGSVELRGI